MTSTTNTSKTTRIIIPTLVSLLAVAHPAASQAAPMDSVISIPVAASRLLLDRERDEIARYRGLGLDTMRVPRIGFIGSRRFRGDLSVTSDVPASDWILSPRSASQIEKIRVAAGITASGSMDELEACAQVRNTDGVCAKYLGRALLTISEPIFVGDSAQVTLSISIYEPHDTKYGALKSTFVQVLVRRALNGSWEGVKILRFILIG